VIHSPEAKAGLSDTFPCSLLGIRVAQSPEEYAGIRVAQSPEGYAGIKVAQSPEGYAGVKVAQSPEGYAGVRVTQSPEAYANIRVTKSPEAYAGMSDLIRSRHCHSSYFFPLCAAMCTCTEPMVVLVPPMNVKLFICISVQCPLRTKIFLCLCSHYEQF
jgi:hypothetical protein